MFTDLSSRLEEPKATCSRGDVSARTHSGWRTPPRTVGLLGSPARLVNARSALLRFPASSHRRSGVGGSRHADAVTLNRGNVWHCRRDDGIADRYCRVRRGIRLERTGRAGVDSWKGWPWRSRHCTAQGMGCGRVTAGRGQIATGVCWVWQPAATLALGLSSPFEGK